MLDRLLQGVPGCNQLKDVLLVKEEAHVCISWLLHINMPYDNLSSEQMTLMLRSNFNQDLIRKRIEENKLRRNVVPTLMETEAMKDLRAEEAWRANVFRVLFEYYGFNGICCRKIYENADKLFFHETLATLSTFDKDKAEILVNVVSACTKDAENVKALERIANLNDSYSWALKRMPPLD